MAAGKKTGGRKKGTPNKATAEIKALAREHGLEAVTGIVEMARNADSESTRLAAWRELLDRGYGKAMQPTDNKHNVAGKVEIVLVSTD